jgi:ethanolamine utilization protein EutA
MHDTEFDHIHVHPEEKQQLSTAIWSADNVELTTIGIDIGSSTSHLMFGRVHMQRLSTALSSRFVVVGREVTWQSPIFLTPYLADYAIDTGRLARFVARCYADAGIARETVDSGAVILTGEALRRRNARAIAELFSAEAGKFVCASAGHHLEAQMAAHGSGAIRLSKERQATLLNVDVGGGTTKFALVQAGETLATVAIAVGGRLVVEAPDRGLVRVEEPAVTIAESLGIALPLGDALGITGWPRGSSSPIHGHRISPPCRSTASPFPAVSRNISTAARRADSAISVPISRIISPTRSPTARLPARSSIPATASARRSSVPRSFRSRSAATPSS